MGVYGNGWWPVSLIMVYVFFYLIWVYEGLWWCLVVILVVGGEFVEVVGGEL